MKRYVLVELTLTDDEDPRGWDWPLMLDGRGRPVAWPAEATAAAWLDDYRGPR